MTPQRTPSISFNVMCFSTTVLAIVEAALTTTAAENLYTLTVKPPKHFKGFLGRQPSNMCHIALMKHVSFVHHNRLLMMSLPKGSAIL